MYAGPLCTFILLTPPADVYHISFPDDRKGIQTLGSSSPWRLFVVLTLESSKVYAVFVLDIYLTIVAAAMGWHVLCAGWGRQTNLVRPGWTFAAIGAGDGISEYSNVCGMLRLH